MYSLNFSPPFLNNDLTPKTIRFQVGARFGNPANCCQDLGICQINDAPYSSAIVKSSTNKGNAIVEVKGEAIQIKILKSDLNPLTIKKHLSKTIFAIYMPYVYRGEHTKKLGIKTITFKQGIYPLADQGKHYVFSPDVEFQHIRTLTANAQSKHSSTPFLAKTIQH